jgi:hypothetical protein
MARFATALILSEKEDGPFLNFHWYSALPSLFEMWS